MDRPIWYARWHVARWMIHTALLIAPPGRARASLTAWITIWGEHVVAAAKQLPATQPEEADG